jgi:hypothetical protein
MTFAALDTWWWPYVFILAAGWLPTGMWRYLGVFFAGNLDENAEILVFIRARKGRWRYHRSGCG